MGRDLNDLFQEAVDLPEGDRATLAGLLIESLERETDPEVEKAWAAEIARRVSELESGAVTTIPWETVRAELFGRDEG